MAVERSIRRRSKGNGVELPAELSELRDLIVEPLLTWFAQVARDLPWRRTRTPYAVWLSEVMLQQTRVETVVPYFQRFLTRFPDVRALAEAEVDRILEAWSGLGYYRRARQLHATAREVVERFGGDFPKTAQGLRALGGVGPYTAGAIASLAFGERTPLVDGNVARVYSRLFALEADPASVQGQRALWAIAAELVPAKAPGAYNEALMELGATVCTPRAPQCSRCPVSSACMARARGLEETLPKTGPKKPPRPTSCLALVVTMADGRVLLSKRGDEGLFAGLWEPPIVTFERAEGRGSRGAIVPEGDAKSAFASVVEGLGGLSGATPESWSRAGSLTHVLSHRRLAVEVWTARLGEEGPDRRERVRVEPRPAGATSPYVEASWVDLTSTTLALSTLARKVLALGTALD